MKGQILIVDHNADFLSRVKAILEGNGYTASIAHDVNSTLRELSSHTYDILLVDNKSFGIDDLQAFRAFRRIDPHVSIIILTSNGNIVSAVNAIKDGVTDYLQKTFEPEQLLAAVERALRERHWVMKTRLAPLEEVHKHTFNGIIGKHPRMHMIFDLIRRVSETDSRVLITGETGVGKELVAKAIHSNGPRKDMPFVAVNCGALTESLLESELFGHEKGSFTGAYKTKVGKFEYAHRGALFLDEVGDISAAMQVKILRVLQEKKVERVGGNHPIDVDVRIIAATNQDLKERVRRREFRLDLFYRLNVVSIHLPPLRQRLEDIPLLVQHFVTTLNKSLNRSIRGVSPEAMKQLLEYHWPGNVRELENVLERAYVTTDEDIINRFTFSQDFQSARSSECLDVVNTEIPFSVARSIVLQRFERDYLTDVLNRYDGNVSEAARKTGINPRTFWRKMKEYGITRVGVKTGGM